MIKLRQRRTLARPVRPKNGRRGAQFAKEEVKRSISEPHDLTYRES